MLKADTVPRRRREIFPDDCVFSKDENILKIFLTCYVYILFRAILRPPVEPPAVEGGGGQVVVAFVCLFFLHLRLFPPNPPPVEGPSPPLPPPRRRITPTRRSQHYFRWWRRRRRWHLSLFLLTHSFFLRSLLAHTHTSRAFLSLFVELGVAGGLFVLLTWLGCSSCSLEMMRIDRDCARTSSSTCDVVFFQRFLLHLFLPPAFSPSVRQQSPN